MLNDKVVLSASGVLDTIDEIITLSSFSHQLGSIHAHNNDQLAGIYWPIGNKEQGTIHWGKELQYLNTIEFAGAFV